MRKLYNRKFIIILIPIVLAVCGITIVFATNGGIDGLEKLVENIVNTIEQKTEEVDLKDEESVKNYQLKKEKEKSKNEKSNASFSVKSKAVKADDDGKENDKTVLLSSDFEDKILSKDKKKIMKYAEKIAKGKKLSKKQQEKLAEYLDSNDDIQYFSSIYDFMYEYFFTYNDLNKAISKYVSGIDAQEIFEYYFDIEESFVAPDYNTEDLAYYQDTLKLSMEQITVMEVLDFRKVISFNEFIEKIKNGERFEEICNEVGVINSQAQINSLSLSRYEVQQCMDELKISEEEAVSGIIKAKKMKVNDKEIIKHLKSKNNPGKELKKHYFDKYSK